MNACSRLVCTYVVLGSYACSRLIRFVSSYFFGPELSFNLVLLESYEVLKLDLMWISLVPQMDPQVDLMWNHIWIQMVPQMDPQVDLMWNHIWIQVNTK